MILSQDEAVALAAGASTGIIADLILFPLDFLKTHAQGNNAPPVSAAAVPAGSAAAASAASAAAATPPAAAGSLSSSDAGFRMNLAGGQPTASSAADVVSQGKRGPSSGLRSGGRARALKNCYSGIAALAMGSMPSSAGFFVVYEVAKEKLKRLSGCMQQRDLLRDLLLYFVSDLAAAVAVAAAALAVAAAAVAVAAAAAVLQQRDTDAPLASTHIAAAAIAESSACVIRNPFEVVKQQVQLGLHASTSEGFSAVWRLEGPRGFFVGLGTSMLRDVPFAAMQLSLWEWFKLKALGESPPSTSFTTAVSGAAGMIAGAVAAVVTTPMDVVKTRLMTQTPGTRQVSS
ncbi:mitochondrial carrier domain-containing protein, putative [Eimeria praecox]|uniref:Mitochondrial carrier domain-containing protein, putative n=1 Tax=Eimeria praecox TaxID=51316 RepID=U6H5B3_9EIME|nr:mitochondrial carrier domain-containing protein, putative [Eimeria praecox]